MNRRGFLAMMDAVIFTTVVMLAMTALLMMGVESETDDRDAAGTLDSLMSSEVRMSDLAEEGDGSLVRVSDLCALYALNGGEAIGAYLEETLDVLCGEGSYTMELTFGEKMATVGVGDGTQLYSATVELPVTTGGTLTAVLTLYRS